MKFSASYGTKTLGPWRRDMVGRMARASVNATHIASLGARDEIRSTMRGVRLGNLANAVKQTSDKVKRRMKLEPNGGFSASGVVHAYSKNDRTSGALAAYLNKDTTIAAKKQWMAIATKDLKRRVGVGGRKTMRMTPARYVAAGLEEKIGPLVFIKTSRANLAYLVVKDVSVDPNRAGSARRLPKNGRLRESRARVGLVAFVLIKQTKRSQRIDARDIAQRWQNKLPRLIQREFEGKTNNFTPVLGTSFTL